MTRRSRAYSGKHAATDGHLPSPSLPKGVSSVGHVPNRLVLVILCLAVLSGGALASPAGWEWQNPLPQGNTLYGVWSRGTDDVFAIGTGGTLLHRDLNLPLPGGRRLFLDHPTNVVH